MKEGDPIGSEQTRGADRQETRSANALELGAAAARAREAWARREAERPSVEQTEPAQAVVAQRQRARVVVKAAGLGAQANQTRPTLVMQCQRALTLLLKAGVGALVVAGIVAGLAHLVKRSEQQAREQAEPDTTLYRSIRIEAVVPAYAAAYFQGLEKRVRLDSNAWMTVTGLPYVVRTFNIGETEVALEAPGFEAAALGARTRVVAGQLNTVSFQLVPQPGQLTVSCATPGAEVFEAGVRLGAVGTVLTLTSCVSHTLEIRAPNCAPTVLDLAMAEPGQSYSKQVGDLPLRAGAPGQQQSTTGRADGAGTNTGHRLSAGGPP